MDLQGTKMLGGTGIVDLSGNPTLNPNARTNRESWTPDLIPRKSILWRSFKLLAVRWIGFRGHRFGFYKWIAPLLNIASYMPAVGGMAQAKP